ncbi:UDP-3-O-acyl-N-acetylglucosamine deacetylase [Falsochrobactrum shanghaiense]|uniref:UDP-3-O-acyl-N-acetylglucosamine deacetylase n=1 Tax=Falsochrobactrum shanghaiense TaxID=2201899 RepID=A0A316J5Q5_9HYPH|nr:UDP-3-O-acyl-N-acetylglucosamine deacetylase [Falsochrobactrum shanghaiense]PWL17262.1 UDP-3-O-acyl-N-acetylglucosamine deacetylase [Falsochrobactrum shanghaiense]
MGVYQKTISRAVTLEGFGVHGGKAASVTFNPAPADQGIVFRRSDKGPALPAIPAHVSQIGATDLCTALGPQEARINTVEHLMAAVAALGIDNLLIEVDGPEIPILDGASVQFIQALDRAGIVAQPARRRFIRVAKTVRVEAGNAWAEFTPYSGTRFEVEINFECPLIGHQKFAGDMSEAVFRNEISSARTFGFMKDVEHLWAAGLALGSSLENSLVIADDDSVINPGGLRFKDEFVRHKTLDAVGDLALAGLPFIGCFRSYRGGHKLNSEAARALLSDEANYEIVELPDDESPERKGGSPGAGAGRASPMR